MLAYKKNRKDGRFTINTENFLLSFHFLFLDLTYLMDDLSQGFYYYLLSGIDFELHGNGGDDCLYFIEPMQRIAETFIAIIICSAAISWNGLFQTFNNEQRYYDSWRPSGARLLLMNLMAMAFGMEFCYKLSTQQLIFIINPCHILCLLQIIILSLNPSKPSTQTVFRLLLNLMHLPILACIFPVTNTLFLPGEIFTYWWEHVLLLIIPIYLLWENQLQPEPIWDLKYTFSSYGLFGLYNFVILQLLAIATLANLNVILCPAMTDPFYGPHYRIHAFWHQLIQGFIGGKLYGLLGKLVQYDNTKSVKKD